MDKNSQKRIKRAIRHKRTTSRLSGTEQRPRISVFRSGSHIYGQLIDDESGRTLASASSQEIKAKGPKTDAATEVGKLLAKKAAEKNITSAVFDRGGYRYHGRVKALAEGAREGGLKF